MADACQVGVILPDLISTSLQWWSTGGSPFVHVSPLLIEGT